MEVKSCRKFGAHWRCFGVVWVQKGTGMSRTITSRLENFGCAFKNERDHERITRRADERPVHLIL